LGPVVTLADAGARAHFAAPLHDGLEEVLRGWRGAVPAVLLLGLVENLD
jgi:hypothetical protein